MSDDEEISVYDEVEIEDMTYDETLQTYHYPCPCGDRFEIALADLQDESTDIAVCPSCSLMIRVIYDMVSHPSYCIRPCCVTCIPIPRADGRNRDMRRAQRAPALFVCCKCARCWLTSCPPPFAQQDNLPKPDEPEPEPPADEKPAQVPVAA